MPSASTATVFPKDSDVSHLTSAVRRPSSDLRPLASSIVRGAGRDPELVAFETSLVTFFVDAADMLGVPKSVAAIYGICFASAEPLSFADIEARLDISKGSISQGLRVLREVGALRVAQSMDDGGRMADDGKANADAKLSALSAQLARGTRARERYEPDLHLRNLVTRWLEQRLQKQLESGQDRLKTIAKTIPAGKQGSAKVLKGRIQTLQTWQKQAGAVLPVVKTFLKL